MVAARYSTIFIVGLVAAWTAATLPAADASQPLYRAADREETFDTVTEYMDEYFRYDEASPSMPAKSDGDAGSVLDYSHQDRSHYYQATSNSVPDTSTEAVLVTGAASASTFDFTDLFDLETEVVRVRNTFNGYTAGIAIVGVIALAALGMSIAAFVRDPASSASSSHHSHADGYGDVCVPCGDPCVKPASSADKKGKRKGKYGSPECDDDHVVRQTLCNPHLKGDITTIETCKTFQADPSARLGAVAARAIRCISEHPVHRGCYVVELEKGEKVPKEWCCHKTLRLLHVKNLCNVPHREDSECYEIVECKECSDCVMIRAAPCQKPRVCPAAVGFAVKCVAGLDANGLVLYGKNDKDSCDDKVFVYDACKDAWKSNISIFLPKCTSLLTSLIKSCEDCLNIVAKKIGLWAKDKIDIESCDGDICITAPNGRVKVETPCLDLCGVTTAIKIPFDKMVPCNGGGGFVNWCHLAGIIFPEWRNCPTKNLAMVSDEGWTADITKGIVVVAGGDTSWTSANVMVCATDFNGGIVLKATTVDMCNDVTEVLVSKLRNCIGKPFEICAIDGQNITVTTDGGDLDLCGVGGAIRVPFDQLVPCAAGPADLCQLDGLIYKLWQNCPAENLQMVSSEGWVATIEKNVLLDGNGENFTIRHIRPLLAGNMETTTTIETGQTAVVGFPLNSTLNLLTSANANATTNITTNSQNFPSRKALLEVLTRAFGLGSDAETSITTLAGSAPAATSISTICTGTSMASHATLAQSAGADATTSTLAVSNTTATAILGAQNVAGTERCRWEMVSDPSTAPNNNIATAFADIVDMCTNVGEVWISNLLNCAANPLNISGQNGANIVFATDGGDVSFCGVTGNVVMPFDRLVPCVAGPADLCHLDGLRYKVWNNCPTEDLQMVSDEGWSAQTDGDVLLANSGLNFSIRNETAAGPSTVSLLSRSTVGDANGIFTIDGSAAGQATGTLVTQSNAAQRSQWTIQATNNVVTAEIQISADAGNVPARNIDFTSDNIDMCTAVTGTVSIRNLEICAGGSIDLCNLASIDLPNSVLFCLPASFRIGAGTGIPIGVDNIAIGRLALDSTTTGDANVALGSSALNATTEGTRNTAVGDDAMVANTTGDDNVAVGSLALTTADSGVRNTAVGAGALQNLAPNSAIGNNIALGYNAGNNYTGNERSTVNIASEGVVGDVSLIRIGTVTGNHQVTYIPKTIIMNKSVLEITGDAVLTASNIVGTVAGAVATGGILFINPAAPAAIVLTMPTSADIDNTIAGVFGTTASLAAGDTFEFKLTLGANATNVTLNSNGNTVVQIGGAISARTNIITCFRVDATPSWHIY